MATFVTLVTKSEQRWEEKFQNYLNNFGLMTYCLNKGKE